MIKQKTVLIIVSFFTISHWSYSQCDSLLIIDEILVTPEQVDHHYEEQVEYYIDNYTALQAIWMDEIRMIDEEINVIKLNEKIRNKDRREISDLEEVKRDIKSDLEIVDYYLLSWLGFEISDKQIEFHNHYDLNKCYDLTTKSSFYSPEDYRVDFVDSSQLLFWFEVLPVTVIKQKTEQYSEGTTTKWVKKKAERNCLSSDPNDCLVWCLVEIPAQTKTRVVQEGGLYCPDGFETNTATSKCTKLIEVENRQNRLRWSFISHKTNKQLNVIDYREVSCD